MWHHLSTLLDTCSCVNTSFSTGAYAGFSKLEGWGFVRQDAGFCLSHNWALTEVNKNAVGITTVREKAKYVKGFFTPNDILSIFSTSTIFTKRK